MPHIQSSRRATPLRDIDYDHEISLVDHEQAGLNQPPQLDEMPSIPETAALETIAPDPPNDETATPDTGDTLSPVSTRTGSPAGPVSGTVSPKKMPGHMRNGKQHRLSIGSAILSMGGAGAALGGGGMLPVPSAGSSNGQYVMAVPNDGATMVIAAKKTEVRGVSRILVDEGRVRSSFVESGSKHPAVSSLPEQSSYTLDAALSRTIDHEWVIDILYENQRGLFLCGLPLFSAKALGNLDPHAWTNAFHKSSLTDIHEAQVPDPTWQWVWPEWRINHDSLIDSDEEGWEYSFMFSNKFSWHGPTWYSSFVRRRAWTRKRVKKQAGIPGLVVQAPTASFGMEFPGSQRPLTEAQRHTRSPSPVRSVAGSASGTRSRAHSQSHSRSASTSRLSMASASRTSRAELGLDEEGLKNLEIYDTRLLIQVMRALRVDREKLEALENYLLNAIDDVQHLQDSVHEIMSLFVFQNSRRLVLMQIVQACDETQRRLTEMGTEADQCSQRMHLQKRLEYLAAAKLHVEEEVRKLAYWSDIQTLGNAIGEPWGSMMKKNDSGECNVPEWADISDDSDVGVSDKPKES